MSTHSSLSPSSAHRWMPCPGSVALSADVPGRNSYEAAQGTVAHAVAEWVLRTGVDSASKYPDVEVAEVSDDGLEKFTIPVDDEMIAAVNSYVDFVRREAVGGEMWVEQHLDLSDVLGVPDQGGTADAVVLSQDGTELIVVDLKYGKGVQVYAAGNPQTRLYGLGALEQFDLLGTIERVRMVIHQPRLDHVDDEVLTVDELRAWGREAAAAAQVAAALVGDSIESIRPCLNPGDAQCRWCPAKARCPALLAVVEDLAFDDLTADPPTVSTPPDDADDLGRLRTLVPLVETWCKAICAEVQSRLDSGQPVTGWKLVEGRRGNRQWGDEEAVVKQLKSFRLKADEMFERKLISPAAVEKMLTDKRWEKVEPLIVQKEGKPQAAPESDKRPAISITSFDNLDDANNDSLIED